MPLHDPSRFCKPLVKVCPAQKLMKLALSLECVSTGKTTLRKWGLDVRRRVHLAISGSSAALAGRLRAGLEGIRGQAGLAGAVVVAALVSPIVASIVARIVAGVAALVARIIVSSLAKAAAEATTTTTTKPVPTPVLSSLQLNGRSVLVDGGCLGSQSQTQKGRDGSLHQHVG
jgi:hypothetical protein